MNEIIVSTKGWVVIPKVYRQKYNLRPGSRVQIVDYGGVLSIVPLPDDPVDALHGLLAKGPSLTADLLAERQKDKAKEDSRLE